LIPFIAESIVISKPWEKDPKQNSSALSNKATLFRLSKTLLELLHCVCSQPSFTRSVMKLSHSMLNQVIQVIEMTNSDDVDPELFGLLHSISLEAEPTPSLTYHTSRRTSGLFGNHHPTRPLNLESPPESAREHLDSMSKSCITTPHNYTNNISVTSIDTSMISGLHSSESQVRLAVILKFAAMRERLGDEGFNRAAKGRLSHTQ